MESLKLQKLSKYFGGVVASENVDMEVPQGKITGLIGPNGAGKTTIVNMITGMLSVSSGSIVLGDQDITQSPAHSICRFGLARTFQNIRLLSEATVLENVMIGFHKHEKSSLTSCLLNLPEAYNETAAVKEDCLRMINEFSMGEFTHLKAGGLSYGHQRRVEIMRALASKPNFILLDEPVAGMNDVESDDMATLFRKLSGEGIGILLIEHNVGFVADLCDHIYVLDGGRLISEGIAEEVLNDPAVISAYLGD